MSREAHSLFTCIFAGKTSVMIRYLLRAADGALSILVVFLLLAGTVVYSGYLLGEDLTSPPEYRKVDILPTGKECRELGTSRFQMVSAGEGIWQFEGGAEPLPYLWRSKDFFTSALCGMTAARIQGNQDARHLLLRVFGPDRQRCRDSVRVRGGKTLRLRPTRAERLWSFELSGVAEVCEARLGSSVEGVEYGQ